MSIRNKLTYQFILLTALLLGVSTVAIYIASSKFRQDEFYQRLESRAYNTAKLLIKVEEIDETLLKKMEEDSPIKLPEEAIMIFDYKDSLLYADGEEGIMKVDRELLDQIRLEGNLEFKTGEREYLGYLFTDDRFDRFAIVISAIDIYGKSKLANLLRVLLIVLGIGLIVVFMVARLYAERALNPIKGIVEEVSEISGDDMSIRVDAGNGKDEIAQLANAFNNMLDRLEIVFKAQKNFIANASHEMRTPLTVISGQLEVILLKDRTSEEYKEGIKSVLEDLKNLNQTTNRLLLLAQTSSEQTKGVYAKIRLDDIVWQASSDLYKLKKDYQVNVSFDDALVDLESFHVKGNDQLLKTAFLNLMENGCKYSNDHSIDVELGKEGKNITVVFHDNGIGIAQEDLKYIFEPFYRGHNVEGRRGHGLGLSLVKRITELHEGTITVNSEKSKGTSFKLSFPAA